MIKKFILPCAAAVIVFAVMAFSTQTETQKEYAMMTVNNNPGNTLLIIYPNGETETKDFVVKDNGYSKAIIAQINNMAKKGYKPTLSTISSSNSFTYIFEKE